MGSCIDGSPFLLITWLVISLIVMRVSWIHSLGYFFNLAWNGSNYYISFWKEFIWFLKFTIWIFERWMLYFCLTSNIFHLSFSIYGLCAWSNEIRNITPRYRHQGETMRYYCHFLILSSVYLKAVMLGLRILFSWIFIYTFMPFKP